MDYVQFLRDAETRTRAQAANINPCADAGDKVKNAILARADEWKACADEMERLRQFELARARDVLNSAVIPPAPTETQD